MITFDPKKHKYHEGGVPFIGTTTLIKHYSQPFDSYFWSRYKALERTHPEFSKHKASLVAKKSSTVLKKLLAEVPDVDKAIKEVKREWKSENDKSKVKGTDYHKLKEDESIANEYYTSIFSSQNYKVRTLDGTYSLSDLEDGFYSELKLWDSKLRIAGTADEVFIETIFGTRYIDINDHKTNKKINKKSFFDTKTRKYATMKDPVSHLLDCNLQHYELQVSIYALMLERAGYTPRELAIHHYDVPYYLTYRPMEVEAMLTHFWDSNPKL